MKASKLFGRVEDGNVREVARCYVRAFCTNGWTEEQAEKRIRSFYAHPLFRGYVKREGENGRVICAAFGIVQWYYNGPRYLLTDFFTVPECQDMGHGTSLMDFIARSLREEEVRQIQLISLQDEHHEHFYNDKNGFSTRSDLCVKCLSL